MLINIISFLTLALTIILYYKNNSINNKEEEVIPPSTNVSIMNKITSEIKNNSLSSSSLQKLIFWSHGGPTFAVKDDQFGCAGAFDKVEQLGNKIKNQYKPDYIVVISAHWQPDYSSKNSLTKVYLSDTNDNINNNISLHNELIYDFYGFPKEMYSWTFENVFNKKIIERITQLSQGSGITIEPKVRGLDHGLWVPGKVAQLDKPTENGDMIPVVQLSMLPNVPLLGNYDGDIKETLEVHYQLGKQLVNKIRADNGLVVLSGMSVHNLRHLGTVFSGESVPYAKQFNDYLRSLILKDKDEKLAHDYETNSLYKGLIKLGEDKALTNLLLQAHAPGIDHFLPFVIGCGALTREEYFKEEFNQETGSLGWGIYSNVNIE